MSGNGGDWSERWTNIRALFLGEGLVAERIRGMRARVCPLASIPRLREFRADALKGARRGIDPRPEAFRVAANSSLSNG